MEYFSDFAISNSNKREDYEILIKKKKENNFVAYCPQLNKMVKGDSFEEVYYLVDLSIFEHIKSMYPDFEFQQISLSDKIGIDKIDVKELDTVSVLNPDFSSEVDDFKIENLKSSSEFLQTSAVQNNTDSNENSNEKILDTVEEKFENENIIFVENVSPPEIEKEIEIPVQITVSQEPESLVEPEENLNDFQNENEVEVENQNSIDENKIDNISEDILVDISEAENIAENSEDTVEEKFESEDNFQKVAETVKENLTPKNFVRKNIDTFKQYSQQDEILS